MTARILAPDDLFILGNIAARAIMSGSGEETSGIVDLLQDECPENAGPFLLEAVHISSKGQVKEAISLLENSPMFSAEVNGDEAIAFYLVLLLQDGQAERARKICTSILDGGLLQSESARRTVLRVLTEIEDAMSDQPVITLS
ncbi:MAG: hypothetical protein MUE98_01475 [Rhodobacteraceae bacterium]|jgi:hypothetical protein|nr:hypothetical protein [Paracoccaceae bacterium]